MMLAYEELPKAVSYQKTSEMISPKQQGSL